VAIVMHALCSTCGPSLQDDASVGRCLWQDSSYSAGSTVCCYSVHLPTLPYTHPPFRSLALAPCCIHTCPCPIPSACICTCPSFPFLAPCIHTCPCPIPSACICTCPSFPFLAPCIHTFLFVPFAFLPADIMPGQGLIYMQLTKSWRVRNCTSNGYGVSNITYGLSSSPCRDCECSAAFQSLHSCCLSCWGDVRKDCDSRTAAAAAAQLEVLC
jgi:hypothetical protein